MTSARKFRTCLFPNKIGSMFRAFHLFSSCPLAAMLTTHQYNVWGQSGDSDKKSKHEQSLEKSQSGDSDKKSKHEQYWSDKTKSMEKTTVTKFVKPSRKKVRKKVRTTVWDGVNFVNTFQTQSRSPNAANGLANN